MTTDSNVRPPDSADTGNVRASDPTSVGEPTEVPSSTPSVRPPSPVVAGSAVLPMLHEVLVALAHEDSRDETLSLLANKARLLTNCASTAIALLDDEGETISFVAASGQE